MNNPFLDESYNVNYDAVEETPAGLGSNVDLHCRLAGEGPMRWERPDGRPLNRARQFPNGQLRIENVQIQDEGVYSCTRGDQTQFVRLKVDTSSGEFKIWKIGTTLLFYVLIRVRERLW